MDHMREEIYSLTTAVALLLSTLRKLYLAEVQNSRSK